MLVASVQTVVLYQLLRRDLASATATQFTDAAPTALTADVVRGKVLDKPKKLLLGGLTPTDDQKMRGDCWLFALMGVLEDSYRRYGVERGWLNATQYVHLSRQAFGIRVMADC